MRPDKFTTRFQEALAEGQASPSPATTLHRARPRGGAMLAQEDGPRCAAGARRRQCRRAAHGHRGPDPGPAAGQRLRASRCRPGVSWCNCCGGREGSQQAGRSVHRRRDVPARAGRCQSDFAGVARGHGLTRKSLEAAIEARCVAARRWTRPRPRPAQALKKYTLDLTERARRASWTGDRPRRKIRRAIQVLQRRSKNNPC